MVWFVQLGLQQVNIAFGVYETVCIEFGFKSWLISWRLCFAKERKHTLFIEWYENVRDELRRWLKKLSTRHLR